MIEIHHYGLEGRGLSMSLPANFNLLKALSSLHSYLARPQIPEDKTTNHKSHSRTAQYFLGTQRAHLPPQLYLQLRFVYYMSLLGTLLRL